MHRLRKRLIKKKSANLVNQGRSTTRAARPPNEMVNLNGSTSKKKWSTRKGHPAKINTGDTGNRPNWQPAFPSCKQASLCPEQCRAKIQNVGSESRVTSAFSPNSNPLLNLIFLSLCGNEQLVESGNIDKSDNRIYCATVGIRGLQSLHIVRESFRVLGGPRTLGPAPDGTNDIQQ